MHVIILIVALLVGLVAPAARAQSCAIIDDYRKAEAAYGRKDLAAAATGFRALAEQGLGPAQLRLGQMLGAGQGAPADPIEAYRWLVLAADVGAPGAKPALTAHEAKLTADQRAAKIDPVTWQAKLGPCLSSYPRGTPYKFELVVNRVVKAPSASGPDERRLKWLIGNLESVRLGSPRYLIYMKALYGIGFVGGTAPFVTIDTRDNLPLLVVNETYADGVTQDRLLQLVTAAVSAVHKALAPAPAVAGTTETYKGRTIRITADDEGKRFLAMLKQAIDMADQLPPDLAKLARALTDLRYEPRQAFDKRGGAVALGIYRHDPATGRGYESYSEMFETAGGATRLVMNLVGTGLYLQRDLQAAEAQRQLADARKRNAAADIAKAEQRVADLEKTHGGQTGDCELEDYEIKTMEALKFDQNQIAQAYKRRARRGCS